uniref:Uncharacterized protein n=1 Tax=mine drainage metagenome TaxID=410659 RepID=E6PD36_9ZZZZ
MLKKIIAGAILSLSVAIGAGAQARACFITGAGCHSVMLCSYHNNGTGGYYVAHTYNYCLD